MAMTLKNSGRSGRRRLRPIRDINVTPLVDVMLVLLIVFMITAPLLTVSVAVDLPKTKAGQSNAENAPIVVTLKADSSIFLQENEIKQDQLIARLQTISAANPDRRVFVRGDKSVAYGAVLQLMGHIQSAGFARVALVAELPNEELLGAELSGENLGAE